MIVLYYVLTISGIFAFCALLVGTMKALDWFESNYPETYKWAFVVSAIVYMTAAFIDESYYTLSPVEMAILLFTAGMVVVHSIVWREMRTNREDCQCGEQCACEGVE